MWVIHHFAFFTTVLSVNYYVGNKEVSDNIKIYRNEIGGRCGGEMDRKPGLAVVNTVTK